MSRGFDSLKFASTTALEVRVVKIDTFTYLSRVPNEILSIPKLETFSIKSFDDFNHRNHASASVEAAWVWSVEAETRNRKKCEFVQ